MKIKSKMIWFGAFAIFSASALAHPVKSDVPKAKKHPVHVRKGSKVVKAVTDSPSNKIDSNAYNFKSLVSSSVNPQTGQLSTSVTLGHLNAHQLAPNFTLTAHYNQGSQANNFNLGEGWAFNLTRYDKTTGTLYSSNGSSYKGIAGSGSCVYSLPKGVNVPNVASCTPESFQYHQLQDIVLNIYKTGSGDFAGAQVIYTDGHREIIDGYGRLAQIIYPRGYSVTLSYTGSVDFPVNITNNFGNKITFQGGTRQIISTVDGQQHIVSLNAGSGAANLISVTEGKYTTTFKYQPSEAPIQPRTNLLQNIIYPSGAQDIFTYNYNKGASYGLPVKVGGQTEYLPIVTQLETKPSTPNEQSTFVRYTYGEGAFPGQNYTGYPIYSASSTKDVLFANPTQFLYETTEDVSLGYNNTMGERITRTYERHHYLMEENIQRYNLGTGKSTPIKDILYSYCADASPGPLSQSTGYYPGQKCIESTPGTLPVTSGLPAAVQTISYDQAGNNRVNQRLTQYDNSGNVTEKINCSDTDVANNTCLMGKTTHSILDITKYAAPLVTGGITNFVLKTWTVTPFDGTRVVGSEPSQLQTLTGLDGLRYYERGTIVKSFQAVGQAVQPLIATTNTWKNGYISNAVLAFSKSSPLDNYGGSHLKSVATSYTRSTDTTNHTFTVTKHLGGLSSSKTYDSASGLLVSETDNAGHVTTHQYDALGRTTAMSKFSNTPHPLKTTYQYQLLSGGTESMIEIEPKSASQTSPYETKTVFDSLGKPIAHYDNMNSTGGVDAGGLTTELSSSTYDPSGKVVLQTENNNTSYFYYNTAGGRIATLYPNGTFSVTMGNVPNNLQMNYLAAIPKGKTQWVFDGFKVIQKVPHASKAFTNNAKNPSDVMLNTYLLPADPAAKNAQGQPVYSGAVQTQITQLESQIGVVLAKLAQEKSSAQSGYAMETGPLEVLDAKLAMWANQAIRSKMYYSTSDAVYDGFADKVSEKDVNGNTTTMQYDGAGRQIAITNPGGNVTHLHYNIINKPICIALGATASATDACVAALNPIK